MHRPQLYILCDIGREHRNRILGLHYLCILVVIGHRCQQRITHEGREIESGDGQQAGDSGLRRLAEILVPDMVVVIDALQERMRRLYGRFYMCVQVNAFLDWIEG